MLSGYLSKKTRDGRWQKRWFETSGIYLTYYKSRKKEKLLAALSLPQVGDITPISADMDGGDNRGGLFSLALDGRLYTLRAQDDDVALDWCVGLQADVDAIIPHLKRVHRLPRIFVSARRQACLGVEVPAVPGTSQQALAVVAFFD